MYVNGRRLIRLNPSLTRLANTLSGKKNSQVKIDTIVKLRK